MHALDKILLKLKVCGDLWNRLTVWEAFSAKCENYSY